MPIEAGEIPEQLTPEQRKTDLEALIRNVSDFCDASTLYPGTTLSPEKDNERSELIQRREDEEHDPQDISPIVLKGIDEDLLYLKHADLQVTQLGELGTVADDYRDKLLLAMAWYEQTHPTDHSFFADPLPLPNEGETAENYFQRVSQTLIENPNMSERQKTATKALETVWDAERLLNRWKESAQKKDLVPQLDIEKSRHVVAQKANLEHVGIAQDIIEAIKSGEIVAVSYPGDGVQRRIVEISSDPSVRKLQVAEVVAAIAEKSLEEIRIVGQRSGEANPFQGSMVESDRYIGLDWNNNYSSPIYFAQKKRGAVVAQADNFEARMEKRTRGGGSLSDVAKAFDSLRNLLRQQEAELQRVEKLKRFSDSYAYLADRADKDPTGEDTREIQGVPIAKKKEGSERATLAYEGGSLADYGIASVDLTQLRPWDNYSDVTLSILFDKAMGELCPTVSSPGQVVNGDVEFPPRVMSVGKSGVTGKERYNESEIDLHPRQGEPRLTVVLPHDLGNHGSRKVVFLQVNGEPFFMSVLTLRGSESNSANVYLRLQDPLLAGIAKEYFSVISEQELDHHGKQALIRQLVADRNPLEPAEQRSTTIERRWYQESILRQAFGFDGTNPAEYVESSLRELQAEWYGDALENSRKQKKVIIRQGVDMTHVMLPDAEELVTIHSLDAKKVSSLENIKTRIEKAIDIIANASYRGIDILIRRGFLGIGRKIEHRAGTDNNESMLDLLKLFELPEDEFVSKLYELLEEKQLPKQRPIRIPRLGTYYLTRGKVERTSVIDEFMSRDEVRFLITLRSRVIPGEYGIAEKKKKRDEVPATHFDDTAILEEARKRLEAAEAGMPPGSYTGTTSLAELVKRKRVDRP